MSGFDDRAEGMAKAQLDLCQDKLLPQSAATGPMPHDPGCECCDPADPGVSVPDKLLKQASDLLAEAEAFVKLQEEKDQKDLDDALACADKIQSAADVIKETSDRLMLARQSEANLEMLWYNYRVPSVYYQKKKEAFETYLGIFDPLVSRKRSIEAQLQADENNQTLQSELSDVEDQIASALQSTGVSEFSDRFADPGDLTREELLGVILAEVRQDGAYLGFPARVAAFSSRVEVVPVDGALGEGSAFDLTVRHTIEDPAGVLSGRALSYMDPSIEDNPMRVIGTTPGPVSGVLYSELYGIWDDPNKFFTPEERGLTENPALADPETVGVVVDGLYIQDQDAYYEFYKDYYSRVYEKADLVKEQIIEPALSAVSPGAELAAAREAAAILAYGNVQEELLSDAGDLSGAVDNALSNSSLYMERLDELSSDLGLAKSNVEAIKSQLDTSIQKLKDSPCVAKGDSVESDQPAAGQDPKGLKSLKFTNEKFPNPTKFCYWAKFSALVTLVNLLPLPGQGGLRYWPVGVIIPTPSGTVKVPLPIIWIPLAVISLKTGIMVVFIAQCGVSPGPAVFLLQADGTKKFVVAPRRGEVFGSDASELAIKTKDVLGGIAEKVGLSSFMDKVKAKVPGFQASSTSKPSATVKEIQAKVMTAVNKLEFPAVDVQAPGFSLEKYFDDVLSKLVVPDLVAPRDKSKLNPGSTQVQEVVDQLKAASKLTLPGIGLSGGTISVRDLVLNKCGSASLETDAPEWPGAGPGQAAAVEKVMAYQKKVLELAGKGVTPQLLGVLPLVAEGGVQILSPYQCTQETSGITVPGMPSSVSTALGVILSATLMNPTQVVALLGSVPLAPSAVALLCLSSLKSILSALPAMEVPDPANTSITTMMTGSIKKVVSIQKLPKVDLKSALVRAANVPGNAIAQAVKTAALSVARTAEVPPTAVAIDLKVILVEAVRSSLGQVAKIADPILKPLESLSSPTPASPFEKFGIELKKTNKDVALVTKSQLDTAMGILEAIPAAAYIAVATTPDIFKNLHPLLTADDIPPWERLSLQNFLFVVFLDMWCRAGKKSMGLQENP